MRQPRPRYIYRLEVVYPDKPSCSAVEEFGIGFRWPRNRSFLSERGAYGRARSLESYGAKVTVVRSDPVTFTTAKEMRRPKQHLSAEKALQDIIAINRSLL